MRGWRASASAATIRSASGASPRVSLSGLPGVTSHQTRSRSSRFMASRQAPRWASCGGRRTLPRIRGAPSAAEGAPARAPSPGEASGGRSLSGARITYVTDCRPADERSRPDLSRAAHAILEAGELLDTDRAAGVKTAGGDADLGAEPELAAVGELGRGVVQHDRGIDLAQEFLRRRTVFRDDRIGMVGAVALDMPDRGVDAVDHLGGDDRVEIFG